VPEKRIGTTGPELGEGLGDATSKLGVEPGPGLTVLLPQASASNARPETTHLPIWRILGTRPGQA
jgi:hypothetical protein